MSRRKLWQQNIPRKLTVDFSLRSAEGPGECGGGFSLLRLRGAGSFYEQLNTRAKACYEALSG